MLFTAAAASADPLPQPLPELLQGYDTTTQITALAHWLSRQPSPRSARVWIATDPDHTARAVVLARIALGSQGIGVGPADWPTPSPSEHRKLLRDARCPERVVGRRLICSGQRGS